FAQSRQAGHLVSFQVLEDLRVDGQTALEVFLGDAGEQLAAQLRRDTLDAFDQRSRRRAEQNALGAAVTLHRLTADQPLALQGVEQPGQRRPFHTYLSSQLALGWFMIEA